MKALSPVSADLIGRLRTIPTEKAAELLRRAEKASPINAEILSREIIEFLGIVESEQNGGIVRTEYSKIEFKRKPK